MKPFSQKLNTSRKEKKFKNVLFTSVANILRKKNRVVRFKTCVSKRAPDTKSPSWPPLCTWAMEREELGRRKRQTKMSDRFYGPNIMADFVGIDWVIVCMGHDISSVEDNLWTEVWQPGIGRIFSFSLSGVGRNNSRILVVGVEKLNKMKLKSLLCFFILLTYYKGDAQTRVKGVSLYHSKHLTTGVVSSLSYTYFSNIPAGREAATTSGPNA